MQACKAGSFRLIMMEGVGNGIADSKVGIAIAHFGVGNGNADSKVGFGNVDFGVGNVSADSKFGICNADSSCWYPVSTPCRCCRLSRRRRTSTTAADGSVEYRPHGNRTYRPYDRASMQFTSFTSLRVVFLRRLLHAAAQPPRLAKFALHPPKYVEVEFDNGGAFNLSAEFLRIHSPAYDALTWKAKSPGSTQNRSILDRIEGYGSDYGGEVPESANFQLDRPESSWIAWIKQGSTDSRLIQADPD
ncbi:hypothetical protein Taro_000313 [Colocasia esculenta]|uniref:Uncharacterized protein n=1 Tax=Colocasia esculenta TaxID=4460 RepID=A0A843TH71_COLES|nr:hypothetical protein [Colocasia esculenta]